MSQPNYKAILFQLVASLTLCDHMGDVVDAMVEAMRKAGNPIPDFEAESEWMGAVGKWLHEQDVTTLWGTSLEEP